MASFFLFLTTCLFFFSFNHSSSAAAAFQQLPFLFDPPFTQPTCNNPDDTWRFVNGQLLAQQKDTSFQEKRNGQLVSGQVSFGSMLPALHVEIEVKERRLGCRTCKQLIKKAQTLILRDGTKNSVITSAAALCVALKIQTPRVCAQLLPQFGPWALEVLTRAILDPEEICSQLRFCKAKEKEDKHIDIPPRKPWSPPPEGPSSLSGLSEDGGKKVERAYVVHLSDWHYDAEYKEGYEAECGEPVCCRPPHSPVLSDGVKRPAGRYGDRNCDVPRTLVESLIKFLPQAAPKVDAVFMTGDMPPHDIWAETQESVLAAEDQTASDLRRAFQKTVVFPAVGNHEGAPINDYPTHRLVELGVADSVDWLYSALADQWGAWLPQNATSVLRERGCYSAPIPSLPNHRVISWNTNLGYRFNWWLLLTRRDEPDPDGVFSWLIDELLQAEKRGERVYLIGHMSPLDSDAFSWFGREFARVISRFSGTIAGQFYGHTHRDEFQMFYSAVPGTPETSFKENYGSPIHVAYVGPSLTPYRMVDPAFRVYEIDKNTGRILNHRTYSFDLDAANRPGGSPQWRELYNAKNAYDMEGLTPGHWAEVANRFETDHDMFTKYIRLRTRNVPSPAFSPVHGQTPCEDSPKCRQTNLCRVQGGRIFPGRNCPGPDGWRGKTPWGGHVTCEESEENGKVYNPLIELAKEDNGGKVILGLTNGGEDVVVMGLAMELLKMVGGLVGWDGSDELDIAGLKAKGRPEEGEEESVCR